MYIFLMRHGDAVDKALDRERPLSEVGVRQVERACEFLDSQSIEIQAICHSQKKRSQQTAEMVATYFDKFSNLKYMSSLDPDREASAFIDELICYEENAIFVGHLPTIHTILYELLESSTESIPPVCFEPATIAMLEKKPNHRWVLIRYFNPDKPEF